MTLFEIIQELFEEDPNITITLAGESESPGGGMAAMLGLETMEEEGADNKNVRICISVKGRNGSTIAFPRTDEESVFVRQVKSVAAPLRLARTQQERRND